MTSPRENLCPEAATIAIVTALPKEYASVKHVLGLKQRHVSRSLRTTITTYCGKITTVDGDEHTVITTLLPTMGNDLSTSQATLILEHYSQVQLVFMVGIAGAVPNIKKVEEHVRLGDIVALSEKGVIQYDLDKESLEKDGKITVQVRNLPRPPACCVLEAVKLLESDSLLGDRPWENYIRNASLALGDIWKRPSPSHDVLHEWEGGDAHTVLHPSPDPHRTENAPRVFVGAIASANKLLKNPQKRDYLRDTYSVRAVEMEAAGVADAAWKAQTGFYIVRGTCDYCDPDKGQIWQEYAAVIAASYTRSIIENLPAFKLDQVPAAVFSELNSLRDELTLLRATRVDSVTEDTGDLISTIEMSITDPQESSQAPMPSLDSQNESRSMPSTLTPVDGERLFTKVKILLSEFDILEAASYLETLETWLAQNEAKLEQSVLAGYYELLSRISLAHSRFTALPAGKPDVQKARYYLNRAKNVAKGI